MTKPLIEIKNLSTHFFTDEGVAKAVDDVSLTIPKGKTVGLVGESG
ncbi:MAG: ABC transporter ATP-binding protein, partial [Planctomycetia bacterium]|nr:ABC transporter ATP-binding protein [Planctomycetia bacterium]